MRLVGNQFDETAAFTESVGFGTSVHGKSCDPHAVIGGACLFGGVAEAGDLWMAECHSRHHAIVQRHRFHACNGFGSYYALCGSDEGELNFGGDVADRIDVRRGRTHLGVDVDRASGGDPYSSGVETDSFNVGTKYDADEGPGGLRGGGRSVSAGVVDDDTVAVVDDFVHPGGCV